MLVTLLKASLLALALGLGSASHHHQPPLATVAPSAEQQHHEEAVRLATLLGQRGGLLGGGSDVASQEYDFIVVGGGIGGCILADRLTQSGRHKVLLLEAGKPSFWNKLVNIPTGVIKLFKSAIDWQFESEPEKHLDGKEVYLIRGKALGGSSCLNVMLAHRGSASDYESWGQDQWGRGMDTGGGAQVLQGVGDVSYQNPLSKMFLSACQAIGMRQNDDFNDWSQPQEGYGRFKVSQHFGRRWTAAKGYLRPALGRRNLRVATRATASRVVMEGDKAVGVEWFDKKGDRHVTRIKDDGEVLLCGGAIDSPKLLLLSGIGPKEDLQALGINSVVDRQGVGANLQDHPAVVVAHDIKKRVALTDVGLIPGTGVPKIHLLIKWFFTGKGTLTTPGCDHGAYIKTNPALPEADLQLRFVAGRGHLADGVRSYIEIGNRGQSRSGATLQVVGIRAKSRGRVSLQSSNPFDHPRIQCNYLSNPADLESLRKGLQMARGIMAQDAFKDIIGPEVFPGANVQTSEELAAYIRYSLHTANALVGTCRMGKASDPEAVVDPQLRVIGTKNLRVVDASVMPTIPGGQTGAPTVMIAERASDLIRAAHHDWIKPKGY